MNTHTEIPGSEPQSLAPPSLAPPSPDVSEPTSISAPAAQSLEASEPVRPANRRGRRPQLTRELAVELVRNRMLEGTFDEEGIEFKRRTLEQFSRDMYRDGVTRRILHPVLLSRLFCGRMYPDLEIDGRPVDWSDMPSAGRGPAKGTGLRDRRDDDPRSFREIVQSFEVALKRLQFAHEALRSEVLQLQGVVAARGGAR